MSSIHCPPLRLLLFLKNPAEGRVKTRLATALGEAAVVALYKSFVHDILETCAKTGLCTIICCDPAEELEEVRLWLGPDYTYLPQHGANLGERMANALEAAFADGAEKAAVLGTDLPDLPPSLIRQADRELNRTDAVIGPAHDGGYYLFAMRQEAFLREAFTAVDWTPESGGRVFEQTIDALEHFGRSVSMLAPWDDVDTYDDLKHLACKVHVNGFRHSHTWSTMLRLAKTEPALETIVRACD